MVGSGFHRHGDSVLMRVRTLLHLTSDEWIVALAALPLVVTVRVALWVLSSRTILRLVSRLERWSGGNVTARTRIGPSTIIWAVESVSRRIPRATCLTQAIAAKLLLRWSGLDAQLCLGVASSGDGSLRAHAWLEREGRPLLGGAGTKSLVRLPELPDRARISTSLIR
jgi:hypothetical protein